MDIKPNSHAYKAKQEVLSGERKIETVVNGTVKTRKKGGINKLAEIFISEDVSNVKDYIVQDVVVPTIKKCILGALDMILNGGHSSYSDRRSSSSKISYRQYYDEPKDRRRSEPSQLKLGFDREDIVYEYRSDAEAVLDQMCDVIERYGFVTVSDMYEMAHREQPYTGNRYGWRNLRNAKTERVKDGYIIDLPKAEPLD